MRFRKLSDEAKASRRRLRVTNSQHWHSWFAWRPVRIDSTTMLWLEFCTRRIHERFYRDLVLNDRKLKRWHFEYGPITNLLQDKLR